MTRAPRKGRPPLSRAAEDALRAVLFLAQPGRSGQVGVETIAQAVGVRPSYLSKTLQTLARTGVLHSERGRAGGFRLAVAARDLMLTRVIAPFDQQTETRHCLLGGAACTDRTACAAHHAWKQTAEQIAKFFRTTTVADLLEHRHD